MFPLAVDQHSRSLDVGQPTRLVNLFFLTFTNLIHKESTTLICKELFSNNYQVTFAFHLHLIGLFLMTRKNLISFLIFLDKPHSSKLETSK